VVTVYVRTVAYGAAALEALASVVAQTKSADPMAMVTVIAPNNIAGIVARRQLAAGTPERPGIAGIEVTTLARLAERFAAGRLSPRRPASRAVLAASWRQALAANPGRFADIAAHPAIIRALAKAHTELRDLSDTALEAVAASTEIAGELVSLHRDVCHRLETDWYDSTDLGQTMRMLATAISTGNITDDDDLARFVRYNPQLIEHPRLRDHEIRLRWRGLAFRAQAVHAWRQLWADLCGQLPTKGAASRQELRAWLADIAPPMSVREFLTSLPSTVDSDGAPVDAEGDPTVQGLAVPLRRLAVILLGAQRYTQLAPTELLGFAGPPGSVDHVEELSPHWASHQLAAWADRSMSDFYAHIVDVLIARSQRIALRKSTYNLKTGRFTIPARVRVQGDHLFQIFPESANKPGLRWAQLMSMGRQTDLFRRLDGIWRLGPRGDLVA
jgi:hypothetical protein